jgi:hypothetical protein
MSNGQFVIVDAAKGLARNPLGIIALFIVLVYGFASLLTALGGSLSREERLPLIYFLVVFSSSGADGLRLARELSQWQAHLPL